MLGGRIFLTEFSMLPRFYTRTEYVFGKSFRVFSYRHNSDSKSTVRPDEVEKFRSLPFEWWVEKSSLQKMNALRVPLVRDGLLHYSCHRTVSDPAKPLRGFSILDVGCGVGLFSEPLARLGANVTGLDPSPESIEVARAHASLDTEIGNNLNYVCDTIESFKYKTEKFDAVVCSEVIEHVDNVPFFVECCVDAVKDKGSLFFTTINQTVLSYIIVIVLAEYVTRQLPIGTHSWKQFVLQSDLQSILQRQGCRTILTQGMFYNPLTLTWSWTSLQHGSYALHAVKND